MNKQEIFDKAATHLLKQKARARKEGGQCVYRAPNGRMCAIGCLIPDEVYDPRMEGGAVTRLMSNHPAVQALLGKENEEFLIDLQRIHDRHQANEWPRLLASLCNFHNLSPSALSVAPDGSQG